MAPQELQSIWSGINYDKEKLPLKRTSKVDVQSEHDFDGHNHMANVDCGGVLAWASQV